MITQLITIEKKHPTGDDKYISCYRSWEEMPADMLDSNVVSVMVTDLLTANEARDMMVMYGGHEDRNQADGSYGS